MHLNGFGIASGTAARVACGILLAFSIAGCKFTDRRDDATPPTTDTGGSTSGSGGSSGGGTSTANRAPTVSGSPVTLAKVSVPYLYQPRATDPDGDRLSFQVRGKPDWASFDVRSGRLEGTPPAGSTGTYTGVQISVSDGSHTVELPPFSISVVEPVVGSAELVWQPPATNEDGTPLVDLSGYVIRFGRSPGTLDQSVRIGNAGTTIYVVENLVEGTWYFSLSAVNGAGVESRPTGYISKTIG
jgi:hypothetical protein